MTHAKFRTVSTVCWGGGEEGGAAWEGYPRAHPQWTVFDFPRTERGVLLFLQTPKTLNTQGLNILGRVTSSV